MVGYQRKPSAGHMSALEPGAIEASVSLPCFRIVALRPRTNSREGPKRRILSSDNRDKIMRTSWKIRARARQLSGPAHRPRSWSNEIDFSPMVLAHWCCAWAAPTIMPRALVVTILTHVLLRQATCLVTEKRGTSRSRSLLKALSLALEILVTLLALSMRLSPIERDLIAASLFALLWRVWRPSPREGRSFRNQTREAWPVPRYRLAAPSVWIDYLASTIGE